MLNNKSLYLFIFLWACPGYWCDSFAIGSGPLWFPSIGGSKGQLPMSIPSSAAMSLVSLVTNSGESSPEESTDLASSCPQFSGGNEFFDSCYTELLQNNDYKLKQFRDFRNLNADGGGLEILNPLLRAMGNSTNGFDFLVFTPGGEERLISKLEESHRYEPDILEQYIQILDDEELDLGSSFNSLKRNLKRFYMEKKNSNTPPYSRTQEAFFSGGNLFQRRTDDIKRLDDYLFIVLKNKLTSAREKLVNACPEMHNFNIENTTFPASLLANAMIDGGDPSNPALQAIQRTTYLDFLTHCHGITGSPGSVHSEMFANRAPQRCGIGVQDASATNQDNMIIRLAEDFEKVFDPNIIEESANNVFYRELFACSHVKSEEHEKTLLAQLYADRIDDGPEVVRELTSELDNANLLEFQESFQGEYEGNPNNVQNVFHFDDGNGTEFSVFLPSSSSTIATEPIRIAFAGSDDPTDQSQNILAGVSQTLGLTDGTFDDNADKAHNNVFLILHCICGENRLSSPAINSCFNSQKHLLEEDPYKEDGSKLLGRVQSDPNQICMKKNFDISGYSRGGGIAQVMGLRIQRALDNYFPEEWEESAALNPGGIRTRYDVKSKNGISVTTFNAPNQGRYMRREARIRAKEVLQTEGGLAFNNSNVARYNDIGLHRSTIAVNTLPDFSSMAQNLVTDIRAYELVNSRNSRYHVRGSIMEASDPDQRADSLSYVDGLLESFNEIRDVLFRRNNLPEGYLEGFMETLEIIRSERNRIMRETLENISDDSDSECRNRSVSDYRTIEADTSEGSPCNNAVFGKHYLTCLKHSLDVQNQRRIESGCGVPNLLLTQKDALLCPDQ